MPKAVHITTPWPDLKKEARRLGISKTRQKELTQMAEEIVQQIRQSQDANSSTTIERNQKLTHDSAAD